ncbi:MAG: N-acetyltransferase [Bacteroidetes bacterium]|nr:MAG: N-acetyltransferase [Bacteroidota bacterium]
MIMSLSKNGLKRLEMLKGKRVHLRTPEMEDVSDLMRWENDPENWKVSETQNPYTEEEIENFVDRKDTLEEDGQQRFIICRNEDVKKLGTLDVFDAEPAKGKLSVGVLIADPDERGKGYAKESLMLMVSYLQKQKVFEHLIAHVQEDNSASKNLFESCDFKWIGTKEASRQSKVEQINERIYQLCLNPS